MVKKKSRLRHAFDLGTYLATSGIGKKTRGFERGQVIFSQGDASRSVLYLRTGTVKIAATSSVGREAVVALLRAGDFFGEGSIAGQKIRVATATAMTPASVLEIDKREMLRVLHEEHDFSDRFVAHMLRRNVRVEEDLVDQLFNSSEKRLARALLLIARYGKKDLSQKVVIRVSQETLADMIGTTRSRVSFFMNKFRRLGFIQYNGGLRVNDSLLRVILHD
jgi:CRP/FNR family transcriptional regulator, cyclic AMP receptor protein